MDNCPEFEPGVDHAADTADHRIVFDRAIKQGHSNVKISKIWCVQACLHHPEPDTDKTGQGELLWLAWRPKNQ